MYSPKRCGIYDHLCNFDPLVSFSLRINDVETRIPREQGAGFNPGMGSQGFYFFIAGMSIPVRHRVLIVQLIRVLCRLMSALSRGVGGQSSWERRVLPSRRGKDHGVCGHASGFKEGKLWNWAMSPSGPEPPDVHSDFFLFSLKITFIYVYMHAFARGFVHTSAGGPGGRKSVSDPLELQLQVSVNHLTWVLGTKLSSSTEAVGSPSLGALSSPNMAFNAVT